MFYYNFNDSTWISSSKQLTYISSNVIIKNGEILFHSIYKIKCTNISRTDYRQL